MMKSIVRSAALAGLLALLPCAAPYAQEVTTPSTISDLFEKLARIQDANIGVARQISETQQEAAVALQDVIDEGVVTDPVQLKLAQTFLDNAVTLASILLSPMATQNGRAVESMQRLLRSNIAMLESARVEARKSPELAAALERYAALQAQTEDLIVALSNGWNRYGEVVRTAQLAGMIRPGSFDAVDSSWTLANTGTAIASQPELGVDVQATATVPLPALTGNPVGSTQVGPTEGEPIDPNPVSALAERAVPGAAERLDATAPLEVTDLSVGGKLGDWTIEPDGTGLLRAWSANLNPATVDRIGTLVIACGESGQLYYQFAGGAQFENYAVYSDDTLSRTVIAEANIVNGPEASAMADSWRIAYDWAQRDPKTRRLVVAAVDDDEVPAQFSSSGYMDARGKVLDACVQGIVAQAMGTAPPAAEIATPEPAKAVAEKDLSPGAVIIPNLAAPVPHVRPKSLAKQGPVDIMAGN